MCPTTGYDGGVDSPKLEAHAVAGGGVPTFVLGPIINPNSPKGCPMFPARRFVRVVWINRYYLEAEAVAGGVATKWRCLLYLGSYMPATGTYPALLSQLLFVSPVIVA